MNKKLNGFQGAIFDVDGVLVATPHERAWREALQGLFEAEWSDILPQTSYKPGHFSTAVYQEHVAGKPRLRGAEAALDYFGVPNLAQRASRYAEYKQQYLVELIQNGKFTPFSDGLRFALAIKDMGIQVAAASSSKNTRLFLDKIRLDTFNLSENNRYRCVSPGMTLIDLFDSNVCGRDFKQGKPHPEIFLTAAKELHLLPEVCFVIEDATSGILAAQAAEMASLGIARLDDEALLREVGPDLVVTSLDDVGLEELAEGRLKQRSKG